jgi:hypothetical protein
VPLVILDEIHKSRNWKRTLKGIYDTLQVQVDLLVTGSARLAVYRRGSDSLLGRQRTFRLHPFSLGELQSSPAPSPDELRSALLERRYQATRTSATTLERLILHGPFPEPYLTGDARKTRLWRRGRTEAVFREDLRDLTRIPELSRVEQLAALLPERVGSPVSVTSLRELLEVSHDTVKRWLLLLAELYYVFVVPPYTARVSRSLRKEPKIYLWDYGEVTDPGPQFENLVASHLLKACHYWTDTGEGEFELRYLRNKDKKELDFLIVRDGKPWLPVEAKLSDAKPAPSFTTFMKTLRCPLALQLVRESGHRSSHPLPDGQLLVLSADEALRYFP